MTTKTGGKSNRGFAAMDKEKQREISSKGGKASGGSRAANSIARQQQSQIQQDQE